jgi:heptosyltransferase-2
VGVIDLAAARRIYVRLPNWVGDVLLATPFLRALRRAAPGAEVALHGKRHVLPVLEGEGLHDVSLPLGPTRGLLGPIREGRRVRAEWGAPDLAFVLPNSFSSAVVARATGARERLGYALDARRLLLTRALHAKKEGRLRPTPMVDYYLGLAAAAGASTDGLARRPVLAETPAARARADALLARFGLAGARVWALNIGASWATKRWLPGHAARLCALIEARGARPLLLAGPDERDLARAVVEARGAPVAGADEVVPLTDLAPVLRRCEMFITTDSGPRHFGVAAGAPVLVLVGSTHQGYTQVDYERLAMVSEAVDCAPCHLKACPIDFRCMTRLLPERVVDEAEALLARLAAPAGPTPAGEARA